MSQIHAEVEGDPHKTGWCHAIICDCCLREVRRVPDVPSQSPDYQTYSWLVKDDVRDWGKWITREAPFGGEPLPSRDFCPDCSAVIGDFVKSMCRREPTYAEEKIPYTPLRPLDAQP